MENIFDTLKQRGEPGLKLLPGVVGPGDSHLGQTQPEK